jgi:hypothetical protein
MKISGTPTFFLNGEKVENRGWEYMVAAIEAKLAGKPIPTDIEAPPAEATPTTTPATPAAPASTPPAQ